MQNSQNCVENVVFFKLPMKHGFDDILPLKSIEKYLLKILPHLGLSLPPS